MLSPKFMSMVTASCVLFTGSVMAVERGQALADSCLSCHAGIDQNATIVNLSQYPASAIVSQMKAFRDGTRVSTVMNRHAKVIAMKISLS